MTELLGGLAAGGWALLAGWILPSAFVAGTFGLVVLPRIDAGFARDFTGLGVTDKLLVLALAAAGLGLLLSALQTPLYRVLEGYIGSTNKRRASRERKQRKRRDDLRKAAEQLDGLRAQQAWEEAGRYPVADNQLAPTRLGNAIRAFETYAQDRYKLDSQTLWNELLAVVPESLRTEVERARASVDFFVCLVYLSLLFAAATLGMVSWASRGELLLIGSAVVACLLALLWYRLAVTSTRGWASATQALVNAGRKPLAAQLGLILPTRLEDERTMWQRVGWQVGWPYDEHIEELLLPFRLDMEERRS